MNDRKKSANQTANEVFTSLFAHASPRKRAPEKDEQEIRQLVLGEWRQLTEKRRERRRLLLLAIAASLLLALTVLFNAGRFAEKDMDVQQVAHVEKQVGEIIVFDESNESWQRLDPDQRTLVVGQTLETGEAARMAIAWNAGGLLRVDEKTRIAISGNSELQLLFGRIHYDSDSLYSTEQPLVNLLINTPFGAVRHMGTQFMTDLAEGVLSVSVREGEVAITGSNTETLALAGEQIIISDSGIQVRQSILPYAEDWKWVQDIAPVYELDGRSMFDFLQWIRRESGYDIEFATDSAKFLAEETILHGSIDLPPMRALEIMFQTSDLTYQLINGVILVSTSQIVQAYAH
jgi:ferric-dicitrate binding protein FerR (iron transport regulator)